MKLLIVDDERSVRAMTRMSINLGRAGITEVYEAGGGQEALQILHEHHPDVALIDMNMPGIDGAELMRLIGESGLSVRLVVVSGYDDFTYAKQALLHNAVNYILKPIDLVELNDTLERIGRELGQRDEIAAQQPCAEAPDAHVLDAYDKFVSAHPEHSVIALRVFIDDAEEAVRRFDGDRELMALEVVARLSEELDGRGVVVKSLDGAQLIYIFLHAANPEDIRLKARELCDRARARLMARGLYCAFGVADGGDYSALQGCARALMEGNLLSGGVFFESEARQVSIGVELAALGLREGILCASRMHNASSAVRFAEHAFAQMRADGFVNLGFLRALVQELPLDPEGSHGDSQALSQVFGALDFDVITGRLLDLIGRRLRSTERSNRPDDLTARATNYILSHYREPITLDVLARTLYASREHICKQFKKTMGVNLSAYLRGVRLERAFILVQRTERSINDIAQEVGFSDSSYFIKSFRRQYGCAPAALRKRG